MTDSRLPTQFENGGAPRLKRRLAAIPSWMLSLVLHGGLIVVLAATLSTRSGGIVGDPNGDFRRIGIYVGHSGDGSEGTGGGKSDPPSGPKSASPTIKYGTATTPTPPATSQASKALAPEAPPKDQVPQPKSIPTPLAPIATATETASRPAPIIGPGPAEKLPVAEAKAPPAPSQSATSGEASPAGAARSSGRWDGLAYETKGGASGAGGGPRGSYGTAPFFGIWDAGAKFVYVIDCSGSMFSYRAIEAAKNELLSSLGSLKRSQQFQIVFYNLDQRWLKAPGKTDFQYFPASTSNRRLAAQFIAEVQPDGGTLHLPALKLALRLHPDVIYFLTDAGEPAMKPEEMEQIRQANAGLSRIHCIQFGMNDNAAADFLRKLAADNNGDFAYQNVKRFAEGRFPLREARVPAKPASETDSSTLPGR
jgi:VWA domain-containing protein